MFHFIATLVTRFAFWLDPWAARITAKECWQVIENKQQFYS